MAVEPTGLGARSSGQREDEECIFHQDGASCHMPNSTAGYLENALPENTNFTGRGEWPANSPDLNPIERLRAILQDRAVRHLGLAYSEGELIRVVEGGWWAIPQPTTKAPHDGIDGRVARFCADNLNGGRFGLHEEEKTMFPPGAPYVYGGPVLILVYIEVPRACCVTSLSPRPISRNAAYAHSPGTRPPTERLIKNVPPF